MIETLKTDNTINVPKNKDAPPCILLFFSLLLAFYQAYGQENGDMLKTDTVYVVAGHFFSIGKYVYEINSDTVFIIPSKIEYKIKRNPEYKAQAFYDSLEVKASNKRWKKELYNLLIDNDKGKNSKLSVKTQRSEDPFMPYEGLIIKNIYIKKLDVFGPTVTDTTRLPKTWTERTGNKLHLNTNEWVIRNNIIIKEGQVIDPFVLADNERLLRQLPYIHQAKIYVINVTETTADILVITKDVWSNAFGIAFDNTEEGSLELWEKNLLGLGREIQYNLYWNTEESPKTGHEGIFHVRNMYGTFLSGTLNYMDAFETQSYGFNLSRPFYTPNIKYAGGVSTQKMNTEGNFAYPDTVLTLPVEFFYQSAWVGRSFSISRKSKSHPKRSNLILSASLSNIDYTKRPDVDINTRYAYHNRLLFLGSIAITHQNYYNSNLVYNFGKTEDIPYGSAIQFTMGPEYNEFNTRLYLAGNISGAKFDRSYNYYYGRYSLGGFSNNGKLHQGVMEMEGNYITRLYTIGTYKFRHFVNVRYLRGINRFYDEYTTLNDRYGIRGFKSDSLANSNKLLLKIESVSFTPWDLYGFHFAIYGFADIGFIGPDNKSILKNDMYSGVGIGIRIRNEKLAFKTFQIRFAYYPMPPADMDEYMIQVSGGDPIRFQNFFIQEPTILDYR
ncbi:MAG: hypothetical protein JXB49_27260 [Bacteroidales bacterium]|nr:hypothetical protein [Bacteroidales bacterium]